MAGDVTLSPEQQLEHQRKLSREASARYREKKRAARAAAKNGASPTAPSSAPSSPPPTETPPAPPSSAPPPPAPPGLAETPRLETVPPVTTSTTFPSLPPTEEETAASAELAAEKSDASADKLAALLTMPVALVAPELAGSEGVTALAAQFGLENPGQYAAQAVAMTHAAWKNICLKWDVGIDLPYEDELVAFSATGVSLVYLIRKLRRRRAKPIEATASDETSEDDDESSRSEIPNEPLGSNLVGADQVNGGGWR